MHLYVWSSTYLKDYGPGMVAVMARDLEQARANARQALLADLKERFDWLYLGLTGHEILEDEDIRLKHDLIEADLAAEPVIQSDGVIIVRGSQ